MTSAKQDGVARYLELLKLLPFGSGLTILRSPVASHSSRFALEPFASALGLWLSMTSTQIDLPRNLQEYLVAAVDYYLRHEWRTSVVLSAIAVETVLADFYEGEFHETLDIPIGAMQKQIKKKLVETPKKNLLEEIDSYVDRVNASRIAAVHRGSKQVSQTESMECLRGAIRAVIWYYVIDAVRRYGP